MALEVAIRGTARDFGPHRKSCVLISFFRASVSQGPSLLP
uniref:Uncharacterized protein n=1 Tax=Anguilla anguilla TaxID=7936 RepID=A0A0E9RMS0_ANGAN